MDFTISRCKKVNDSLLKNFQRDRFFLFSVFKCRFLVNEQKLESYFEIFYEFVYLWLCESNQCAVCSASKLTNSGKKLVQWKGSEWGGR